MIHAPLVSPGRLGLAEPAVGLVQLREDDRGARCQHAGVAIERTGGVELGRDREQFCRVVGLEGPGHHGRGDLSGGVILWIGGEQRDRGDLKPAAGGLGHLLRLLKLRLEGRLVSFRLLVLGLEHRQIGHEFLDLPECRVKLRLGSGLRGRLPGRHRARRHPSENRSAHHQGETPSRLP